MHIRLDTGEGKAASGGRLQAGERRAPRTALEGDLVGLLALPVAVLRAGVDESLAEAREVARARDLGPDGRLVAREVLGEDDAVLRRVGLVQRRLVLGDAGERLVSEDRNRSADCRDGLEVAVTVVRGTSATAMPVQREAVRKDVYEGNETHASRIQWSARPLPSSDTNFSSPSGMKMASKSVERPDSSVKLLLMTPLAPESPGLVPRG